MADQTKKEERQMGLAMTILVLAVVCAILATFMVKDGDAFGILLAVFAVLFLGLGIVGIHANGAGNLATPDGNVPLKVGVVYKTMSVAKIADKEYAVVLQTEKGKVLAYLFETPPPKVFVKTNDKENPYRPVCKK